MHLKFEIIKPHQEQFVNSDKRFVLNSGGVGSGKTYGIVLKTLKLAIEHPSIFILIGAQTYPLLRDTTLREFLNVIPNDIIKSYNKTEQHFKFKNGSEVIFRSFDDENKLKSLNLGACGVEEMTDIHEEIFKMLRTRMRQDKMPGCIFGATNPGAFGNWVYKYFIDSQSAQLLDNSEVVYSVSADNFYLPVPYLEDLEQMRRGNPEYYERMVMGRWGVLEGLIYSLPMGQRITDIPRVGKLQSVIAGLDFGYEHPTAMVIIGRIEETNYVIDEVYRRGLTSGDIIEIAREKVNQYKISNIYCDSSRPEIIEDMRRAGLPAEGSIKDVFDGIMYVKSLIGLKKLYVNQACTYTLREFDSYAWDKKNTVKEVPLKINDDCLDALRMALYTDSRKYINVETIHFQDDRTFDFGDERISGKMDW